MDTQTKRAIVRVSRLILGALFIFSGLTKCIEPMGGAIKVEDYFVAWGWDGMPWWVCMALSTIQNILEFSTGFMLFCGAFIEVSSAIALSFMVFFTPLTLYIAIANPVSDCGCFGDAFKITNWQTFGKNVFFLAVAIVVFVWRKVEAHDTKRWRQLVMTVTGITVASLITIKGITDEPIIDFRPYAVGTDINASMSIPEGAPQTEYKTTFILEKDGQLKEFDENTYPYDDPTWVYKDTRSEIIKEGYVPPITDFTFTTEDGDLMTDSLLHSSQPIILALSVKLENASDTALHTRPPKDTGRQQRLQILPRHLLKQLHSCQTTRRTRHPNPYRRRDHAQDHGSQQPRTDSPTRRRSSSQIQRQPPALRRRNGHTCRILPRKPQTLLRLDGHGMPHTRMRDSLAPHTWRQAPANLTRR